MASYHAMPAPEVLAALGTDPKAGLSEEEARKRLVEFGPNELKERPGRNPLLMLLDEFRSVLVLILLAAAGISAFLGEWLDAAAIFAIVILNAFIGFTQEYRAEKALQALRRLLAPVARAVRGGARAEGSCAGNRARGRARARGRGPHPRGRAPDGVLELPCG